MNIAVGNTSGFMMLRLQSLLGWFETSVCNKTLNVSGNYVTLPTSNDMQAKQHWNFLICNKGTLVDASSMPYTFALCRGNTRIPTTNLNEMRICANYKTLNLSTDWMILIFQQDHIIVKYC